MERPRSQSPYSPLLNPRSDTCTAPRARRRNIRLNPAHFRYCTDASLVYLSARASSPSVTFAECAAMWSLQTEVESLMLPADGAGRAMLVGTVAPWNHLVRDTNHSIESREAIAAAPVRWSIWPWHNSGRKVQLPASLAHHEDLEFMVRTDPSRVCLLARYPKPGRRVSDATIELVAIVPPEQFARYDQLVRFAMMMPSGYLGMTIKAPATFREEADGIRHAALIEPGTHALMEGIELVVARTKPQGFTKADIRPERRSSGVAPEQLEEPDEYDDEWMMFAAVQLDEERKILEDSVG